MAKEKKKLQSAYYENEIDANKYMSMVNAAAGLLAILIWIMYLTGAFLIPPHFYLAVCIMFPCIALLMLTPLFLMKTELVKKSGYKYFILLSLLIAIISLNIALPKHSLLFWPFAVLIANHYYNPKIGRIIYGVTMISMLLSMYLGMFLGEFDENLFGGGVVMPDGSIGTVETIEERIELLHDLMINGNNRYLKVLFYYYFPRALIVTLFFLVSNLLNRRTYKLLDREIKIHDEQEKSKTELSVAKEIQMNTLPEEIIDSMDVEIIGELKPAKEIGGDLYDYLEIDKNHVAILIGDVSGKGVPAAMFMMKTITSFRDVAAPGKTPSQILKEVNASIMRGNKKLMFVTCFLAILDKRNGKLVYSNAGHNPPIVGHNHEFRYLRGKSGILLGIFKECKVEDEEITLAPGDSITLYTDGITEARDEKGNFYGEERLLEVFNRYDFSFTLEIHHTVKDAVAGFVKNAPQSDDITLVSMKYQGGTYSYKEREFAAKKENIPTMLDFIKKFGKDHEFPEDFKNKLVIVGDEVFSNIISHGYENEGGSIFVRQLFDESKNEFVITIIDSAKAFNPLKEETPTPSKDSKNIHVGGLGLVIVKNIMTESAYDRINGKNILVLRKRF